MAQKNRQTARKHRSCDLVTDVVNVLFSFQLVKLFVKIIQYSKFSTLSIFETQFCVCKVLIPSIFLPIRTLKDIWFIISHIYSDDLIGPPYKTEKFHQIFKIIALLFSIFVKNRWIIVKDLKFNCWVTIF